jgi:flagellin-like protein
MNMNNKRGISAIVATVLIILITVAAVTIIWAAIIPLVSNQLEKGSACLDATSQLSIIDQGYTCYGGDGNANDNVSVQVKLGAGDIALAGIQVISSDSSGNSISNDTISNTFGSFPGTNEVSILNPVVGDLLGPVTTVSVAPMITLGNSVETCDISATLAITACA